MSYVPPSHMIDSLHMKVSDMDQGVMFSSLSSWEKDAVGYPVTGVETIELCGRHLNGSVSERASSCGQLLGGMTPSPSEDQVTTMCPTWRISGLENPRSTETRLLQVGIERELPEKEIAVSGRLAVTLMGSLIPFLYGSELGSSSKGSKDRRGSQGCLS